MSAFGVVVSWLFFGHQVVPNPDFLEFRRIGEALWDGTLPRAQRGPLLGLVQVGLGRLLGDAWSTLEAAWLLNAVAYPLGLILCWSLLRRPLGILAAPVSLLAWVNPWVVQWLVQPLAELPLQVLFLACLHLAVRGSRWSYLLAALAALLRWDGVALVFLCIVALRRDHAMRRSLPLAVLAFLPCAAWAGWCWSSHGDAERPPPYVEDVQPAERFDAGAVAYLGKTTQRVVLGPLAGDREPRAERAPSPMRKGMVALCGALALIGLAIGIRRGDRGLWLPAAYLLPFAAFLTIYWIVPRYVSTLGWWLLASIAAGLAGLLRRPGWFDARGRAVTRLLCILSIPVIAVFLLRTLPRALDAYWACPPAELLPFLLAATATLIVLDRPRGAPVVFEARVVLLGAMLALGSAGQPMLCRVLGNGEYRQEFAQLGDWLSQQPGPVQLRTSLPRTVGLFAPGREAELRGLDPREFSSPEQILEDAAREGDTHVALFGSARREERLGPFPVSSSDSLFAEPEAIEGWRPTRRFDNPSHRCFIELWQRDPPPRSEDSR